MTCTHCIKINLLTLNYQFNDIGGNASKAKKHTSHLLTSTLSKWMKENNAKRKMSKQDSILDVFIVTLKVNNWQSKKWESNKELNRMTFGKIQTLLA